MVYHLISQPNEGAYISGGLDDLIVSIPWVFHFVEVDRAVLVLYTIILPLKYISHNSGYLVVDTLASSPTSTAAVGYLAVSSSVASIGGQSSWGQSQ